MKHTLDGVLTKDGLQILAAANVSVEKLKPAYRLKPGVVRRCSWTSEIVDNDDMVAAPQQFCREVAANKSAAPGHQVGQYFYSDLPAEFCLASSSLRKRCILLMELK